MREEILDRLRALGTAERVAKEAELRARLRDLERELAEVRQEIPLWRRLLFFAMSPDQAREAEIKAQVFAVRRELEEARRAVDSDVAKVGQELPPFGVGAMVERCAELGRANDPALATELDALEARIANVWAQGLDTRAILERFVSATACQDEADKAKGEIARDARLGWAKAERETIGPRVARRILDGKYFLEQEKTAELTHERNRITAELEKAERSITILERLNVFKFSESEIKRNELGKRLEHTQGELHESRERARRLLEDGLAAFPPLAILMRVEDARAVTSLAHGQRGSRLGSLGKVVADASDAARVLVLAALGRVRDAFREAFPDVPFPEELARALGAMPRERTEPLEPLVVSFLNDLDRSRAPEVRDRALEHAGARASIRRTMERAKRGIPITERLAFWSDHDAKDEVERLEQREKWHADRALLVLDQLPAIAHQIGQSYPPLRLRDAILTATSALQAVDVDRTHWAGPPPLTVNGQEAAINAVKWIARVIEEGWGLEGDEGDLLDEVERAEPAAMRIPRDDRRVFGTISRRELASWIASRLETTSFRDTCRRVREAEERKRAVEAEKNEVRGRISLWDRLNIFSKTPDKQRDRELARALEGLGAELERAIDLVRAQLDLALRDYPPARLAFSLGKVERAIRAIEAVRVTHWETVWEPFPSPNPVFPLTPGSEEVDQDEEWPPEVDEPDDEPIHALDAEPASDPGSVGALGGPGMFPPGFPSFPRPPRPPRPPRFPRPPRHPHPRRRAAHVLRYSLEIEGKAEAQGELESWARAFMAGFGDLPTYRELLERWSQRDAERPATKS